MLIAIIILGILLLGSILFNISSFRALFNLMREINELDELREEFDFLNGDAEIAEDRIAQKFPNAIILCHLEKNIDPNDESTTKIVDISSYPKNHIIGITYFVQHQLFSDLKDSVKMDNLREKILNQFLEDRDIDPDEADMDFINELVDNSIKEVMQEEYDIDETGGAMTRPLIPNCTVYQLKDGRWLWRQEHF